MPYRDHYYHLKGRGERKEGEGKGEEERGPGEKEKGGERSQRTNQGTSRASHQQEPARGASEAQNFSNFQFQP
ncbi:hypothetical protein ACX27_26800 [Nostoc piscinale CENA21]|uniref:Uncharacterized protein n=1 Tax=Nostoc piscinale CENA21 TaxID=224013 RepID=A0A0M5TIL7_9NOSO|nr:hypothetical protein ACX27_26800 [Nostoc piscinale CENA21]